eukprot:3992314-Amphidinium_carterae.1
MKRQSPTVGSSHSGRRVTHVGGWHGMENELENAHGSDREDMTVDECSRQEQDWTDGSTALFCFIDQAIVL